MFYEKMVANYPFDTPLVKKESDQGITNIVSVKKDAELNFNDTISAYDFLKISISEVLFAICHNNEASLIIYDTNKTEFRVLINFNFKIHIEDDSDKINELQIYRRDIWRFLKITRDGIPPKEESIHHCKLGFIESGNKSQIVMAVGGQTGIVHVSFLGFLITNFCLTGHFNTITGIHFSLFQYKQLFTCSSDGSTIQWDLDMVKNQKMIGRYQDQSTTAIPTCLKPNDKNLFVAFSDKVIRVWEINKFEVIQRKIPIAFCNFVTQIEVDSSYLIYKEASGDIIIQLMDDCNAQKKISVKKNQMNSQVKFQYDQNNKYIVYVEEDENKLKIQLLSNLNTSVEVNLPNESFLGTYFLDQLQRYIQINESQILILSQ